MTSSDAPPVGGSSEMPARGSCDKCGMETMIDEEGKLACTGCGFPTDRCNCTGFSQPQTEPGV
jgi:ribosomal protein L37E